MKKFDFGYPAHYLILTSIWGVDSLNRSCQVAERVP